MSVSAEEILWVLMAAIKIALKFYSLPYAASQVQCSAYF